MKQVLSKLSRCRCDAPPEVRRSGRVRVWNPVFFVDTAPFETLFDVADWQRQNKVLGSAKGRGEACFLRRDNGAYWVLRHFRRGGLASRFSADRYLWTGARRTRTYREFQIMFDLARQGLGVPRPVAAQSIRYGLCYEADLITEGVKGACPLADRACLESVPIAIWQAIGREIARLHAHGVWHADLNARNILLDEASQPWLIDFDRARYRNPRRGRWRESNLARLKRSLDKFAARAPVFHFGRADWAALRAGYETAFFEASRL